MELLNVAESTEDLNRKSEVKEKLPQALTNNELYLEFQPIVNVREESIVGFEALLRWKNKDLGIVPPLEFIPLAEEMGLITEIGEWVFEAVCYHKRMLMDKSLPNVYISINVSTVQLIDENILAKIQEKLHRFKIPASDIKIEITESVAIKHFDKSLEKIKGIRDLGIDIYLDDFGSGYSSLKRLELLPISTLKIDRFFVQDVNEKESKKSINEAIVSLAKSLKMNVIAEGIEKIDQLHYLKSIGCDTMQGYYFSKPISFSKIKPLLDAQGRG